MSFSAVKSGENIGLNLLFTHRQLTRASTSAWLRVRRARPRGPSASGSRVSSPSDKRNLNNGLDSFLRGFSSVSLTLNVCFSPTVNGGYSSWEEWAPCSSTCGQGFQERVRLCNSPTPANGGRPCSGLSVDSRKCQAGLCPGRDREFVFLSTLSAAADCRVTCSERTLNRSLDGPEGSRLLDVQCSCVSQ